MRKFETGVTRDSNDGKSDYEGFLSFSVLEAYGKYMTKHRVQADGGLRDSDNWQKGFGPTVKEHCEVCLKSAWRHFLDFWAIHRGYERIDSKTGEKITLEEAGCALLFNIMAYLHIYLKDEPSYRCPEDASICNLGYACDACPYNPELKKE